MQIISASALGSVIVPLCVCMLKCVLFITSLALVFLLLVNEDWTVMMGPIQHFHTGFPFPSLSSSCQASSSIGHPGLFTSD